MSGVVIKLEALPIRPVTPSVAGSSVFCPCDFRCEFREKVFADDSGDGIKNDITDFLFKKITAADTIAIGLYKYGYKVAEITDDTLGKYYPSFTAQPLYVGWQADWTAIFAAYSGGVYQVKVDMFILGQASTYESRYFELQSYDDLEANHTVKIETLQYGKFANGEFDFTNLLDGGWPTSIRLPGEFGFMSPKLDRDIYQDASYRDIQNRDVVTSEYRLLANMIPETIQSKIAKQDMLGNEIFITSYNVLQDKKYQRLPVVPESFSEPKYDGLGRVFFEIVLSDRQKNNIKSNVS